MQMNLQNTIEAFFLSLWTAMIESKPIKIKVSAVTDYLKPKIFPGAIGTSIPSYDSRSFWYPFNQIQNL